MLWDSGVWMWFEYFHTAWLRFKCVGDVGISEWMIELTKSHSTYKHLYS